MDSFTHWWRILECGETQLASNRFLPSNLQESSLSLVWAFMWAALIFVLCWTVWWKKQHAGSLNKSSFNPFHMKKSKCRCSIDSKTEFWDSLHRLISWGPEGVLSPINNAQLVNRASPKTLCTDSVDCHIHCNTYLTFFSIWDSSLRIAAFCKKLQTFKIYVKDSKVMARVLKVRSSSLEGTWCYKYLGRLCICPCFRDWSTIIS